MTPETGVVVLENARLGTRQAFIASAFIERFATDPEPLLSAPGTGAPVQRRNDIVLAVSTNHGTVSEDIMNRSLPIHLSPRGNVADRKSPIGNPRLEFLPANRELIAAELRGLVERWKLVGCPLDDTVRHPFSVWAKTIGGILKTNGFSDFLANYGMRKTADDPVRNGLGLLGAAKPDTWLRPSEWVQVVVELGLIKRLILPADRENHESQTRGIGVVLSTHKDETFLAETDSERLTLRLEKARRRFGESEPHTRYRFAVQQREPLTAAGR